MADKKVKLQEQKAKVEQLEPSIGIVDEIEEPESDITPEQVRLAFATAITTGFITKHGDLGGRDDERIVKGVFRLADLLTDAYFNT